MLITGRTDKGIVRQANQDDFFTEEFDDGVGFVVVCDGMGGPNGGNIASTAAVRHISGAVRDGYKKGMDAGQIKDLLESAIEGANSEVYKLSRTDSTLFGMGTTVVALVATPDEVVIGHAGDSRAYIVGDGMRQLTRDHSVVQEMVESGKITKDEALVHPQKNVITRALGVEKDLKIDFCTTPFTGGEAIVICTDGLTNLVSDESILTAVREQPEECVQKLIDMANDNGGNDNITVVVVFNGLNRE